MGWARLRIDGELLREALGLPIGTEFRGNCVGYNEVELLVRHDDIPNVPMVPGGELPLARPTIKKNVAVELVDWGVDK
jgi:hypothetical protein